MSGRFPIILDGDLAVHQHPAVSRCPLHAAPLAAGQVVSDLFWQRFQVLVVIDDHVRRGADPQHPAVENLVCAPPSETPKSTQGSSTISRRYLSEVFGGVR